MYSWQLLPGSYNHFYELSRIQFVKEVGRESKYNFSRCYCKIVLSWYVDSLECRLRNYAKKLIFKDFVR